MSQVPWGMKIVDSCSWKPPLPHGEERVSFLVRGMDAEDCVRACRLMLEQVPEDMEMSIYHIGLKPDRPVPVARYFIEVEIRKYCPEGFVNLYHATWRGKKKEGPNYYYH